ncbi:unnamed protein product [marine sediment metagenome]|uniref:Methyltransferase type 11 domain-containing protein n=1 Tax=marine sediment metagenome TaxID=412755 RepID=X0ZL44_9ZZZZ
MFRKLLELSFYLRKIKYSIMAKKKGWKQTVLDYYKWELGDSSKSVYSKICQGQTEEELNANDSSIIWHLNPKDTDICLNIGCGIGRIEKFLHQKVKEIHSVDVSQAMIDIAKERSKDFSNVHYYVNDGQSLQIFGDNFFDIAFAELVFQHIPPEVVKSYVSEVHRVLKPGGRFICQIPTKKKYRHMPKELCAWMTREEVDRLFSAFSKVDYNSGCTNEWYHCPIVTK